MGRQDHSGCHHHCCCCHPSHKIQPACEGGDHSISLHVAVFPDEGQGIEGAFGSAVWVSSDVSKGVMKREWLEEDMDLGEVQEGTYINKVHNLFPGDVVTIRHINVNLVVIHVEVGKGGR